MGRLIKRWKSPRFRLCTSGNEDLEEYFREISSKTRLMCKSVESPKVLLHASKMEPKRYQESKQMSATSRRLKLLRISSLQRRSSPSHTYTHTRERARERALYRISFILGGITCRG